MLVVFQTLAKFIRNKKGVNIVPIRNEHVGEFQNEEFEKILDREWYSSHLFHSMKFQSKRDSGEEKYISNRTYDDDAQ